MLLPLLLLRLGTNYFELELEKYVTVGEKKGVLVGRPAAYIPGSCF